MRVSSTPGPRSSAPSSLRDAAQTSAWALALWAGMQLAAAALERRAMVLAMVQAAAAEWGAGRCGITWSDPLAPVPTAGATARRAARGASLGAATAALVVCAALATGSAAMGHGPANVGLLLVGLTASVLAAVRDELLLRGLVLRATRDLLPPWASLASCGAAAAAARFGLDGTLGLATGVEALRGVALAALWVRDRGAWVPWAANASWMWTLGSVAQGGLLDVRFAGEADAGPSAAWVAAGAAIAAVSLRGGLGHDARASRSP